MTGSRQRLEILLFCAVICLGAVTADVVSSVGPLVFDEKIGHYKDLSYEALSEEGLSWQQRTSLSGGQTVHYGELTDRQRCAREKELADRLESWKSPAMIAGRERPSRKRRLKGART